MADSSYGPKIYRKPGGDEEVVVTGGKITLDGGKILDHNGATLLDETGPGGVAASATPVSGVATLYKIARGTTALDGSNPTPVITGLTTVVAFVPSLIGTAAPGVGTSVLTTNHNVTPGTVDVYAWKVTSNADPTLIASTGTESFDWIAVGT